MSTVSTEILIVGAGVLGLCTAVEMTRRGHDVLVLDPGGPNASSVAAGMIAPALEAALDAATPAYADILRQARALWDDFAADLSIELRPGPATWRGGDAEGLADRLEGLGFAFEREGGDLIVPLDAQVDPEPALAAMAASLDRPVLRGRALSAEPSSAGWVVISDAGRIEAQTLILATGAAVAPPGLPEEAAALLARIEPVRGQIGWLADHRPAGVSRTRGAYLAPSRGGALVGATMEPGRRDLTPDAQAGARLLQAASALLPGFSTDGSSTDGASTDGVSWRVGVRGSTPDGLPMAGPTSARGLHLAVAPRRNGWLLGPLVGRIVADAVEGKSGGNQGGVAARLDPRRFL